MKEMKEMKEEKAEAPRQIQKDPKTGKFVKVPNLTSTTIKPPRVYDESKYHGKKVKIRFANLEFPKNTLDFVYGGFFYRLKDSEEYTLPIETIEHLNNLVVPESRYDIDDATGQMSHIVTTLRHRFNCGIVDMASLLKKAAEANEADGAEKE